MFSLSPHHTTPHHTTLTPHYKFFGDFFIAKLKNYFQIVKIQFYILWLIRAIFDEVIL